MNLGVWMDGCMPGEERRERATVDVRHHGGATVLAVAGELDHDTADLLRNPIEAELAEGRNRLVVDCAALEFCDSTGLNVLLGARLAADENGGGVHLVGLRPAVARVLEVTGADSVFTLHDDLASALANVTGA